MESEAAEVSRVKLSPSVLQLALAKGEMAREEEEASDGVRT